MTASRRRSRPNGFVEVVDDALTEAQHGGADVVHAGRHDQRRFRRVGPNALRQPQPVVAGHPDVAHRNRRRRAAHVRERLFGVGRHHDAVAVGREPFRHELANIDVVVDDQNRAVQRLFGC